MKAARKPVFMAENYRPQLSLLKTIHRAAKRLFSVLLRDIITDIIKR